MRQKFAVISTMRSNLIATIEDQGKRAMNLGPVEQQVVLTAKQVRPEDYIAGMPDDTAAANAVAFQLLKRMHPCDSVLPIFEGSGVP